MYVSVWTLNFNFPVQEAKTMKDFFQMNPRITLNLRGRLSWSHSIHYPHPLLQLRHLIAINHVDQILSFILHRGKQLATADLSVTGVVANFWRADIQACLQFYFQVAPILDCCWDSSQEVRCNTPGITILTPNAGNYNGSLWEYYVLKRKLQQGLVLILHTLRTSPVGLRKRKSIPVFANSFCPTCNQPKMAKAISQPWYSYWHHKMKTYKGGLTDKQHCMSWLCQN